MSDVWNPDIYDRNARFVSDLGGGVVELLAPQKGERILDLGCGDGDLTLKLMEAGADVLGYDSSPSLLESARLKGIDVQLGDGQAMPFQQEFDAVFSNAAMHWMPDQQAVIDGVARALKPGGRFVSEMGGHGNMAAVRVAIHRVLAEFDCHGPDVEPWVFPDPDAQAARLERAGFEVLQISLFPRPVVLPTDMRGWLVTFAAAWMRPSCGDQLDEALDRVTEYLRPILCDSQVRWTADYVRLRFAAQLRA